VEIDSDRLIRNFAVILPLPDPIDSSGSIVPQFVIVNCAATPGASWVGGSHCEATV
jgi:hypothetical protein